MTRDPIHVTAQHWRWHQSRKNTESIILSDDNATKIVHVASFTGPGHADNAALACAAPQLAAALLACLPSGCARIHRLSKLTEPCGTCGYCLGAAALVAAGITLEKP